MTVVVDASVAIKWVVSEAGSQEARELIARETLTAPDLLLAECANVLWAMARRKQISPADAAAGFAAIESAPVRLIPVRSHAKAAQALAFELDQTVYDCLYLAAAITEHATLVMADDAFVRAAAANASYAAAVRSLTP